MSRLAPPLSERNETPLERSDRHLAELMQEIRVAQTGVQVLFGFLLRRRHVIHRQDNEGPAVVLRRRGPAHRWQASALTPTSTARTGARRRLPTRGRTIPMRGRPPGPPRPGP
jgi:Family of unknown function (DUF6328)